MPVVKAHGNAASLGQIMAVEAPKACSLPRGVHAKEQVEAGEERRPGGQWRKGARTAQSKGGYALKGRTALSHRLGLDTLVAREDFRPHLDAAKAYHRRVCGDIARTVGGGECPPMVASVVMGAAMQTAAAAYLFERAASSGDPATFQAASRLADSARNNLLGAWELAARTAKARQDANPASDLAAFLAE